MWRPRRLLALRWTCSPTTRLSTRRRRRSRSRRRPPSSGSRHTSTPSRVLSNRWLVGVLDTQPSSCCRAVRLRDAARRSVANECGWEPRRLNHTRQDHPLGAQSPPAATLQIAPRSNIRTTCITVIKQSGQAANQPRAGAPAAPWPASASVHRAAAASLAEAPPKDLRQPPFLAGSSQRGLCEAARSPTPCQRHTHSSRQSRCRRASATRSCC